MDLNGVGRTLVYPLLVAIDHPLFVPPIRYQYSNSSNNNRHINLLAISVAASFQTQGVYKLDGPEFGNSRVYKLDTSIAQLVQKLPELRNSLIYLLATTLRPSGLG